MSDSESNKKTDTTEKQFAQDFKPRFSASKLGELCSLRTGEITKVKFLKQFKPFCDVHADVAKGDEKQIDAVKPRPILLNVQEKEDIKKQLDETIDFKNLKFDDDSLLEAFEKTLRLTCEPDMNGFNFKMSQLLITDDSEQDELSAYLTPESDEEHFKSVNKKIDKEEIVSAKSRQAIRYISNMRGRKLEKHILDRINSEHAELNFQQNKTKHVKDYGQFEIVGIIDGISSDKKTVLEIKTRKNFTDDKKTITKKERLQAFTYMNMLESERCLFVECGPNGELKKEFIDYDESTFRQEIFTKLELFCNYAKDLKENDFINLLIKHNIF